MRVALTGGIATGKSYCLGRFARMGVPTIDADRLAHDAVERGRPALNAVIARFGTGVVQADGRLDRAALGRLVFSDAAARRDLEGIIHPLVYAGISEWFSKIESSTAFAIADVPLLYETGREGDFDAVTVTTCGPEQQMQRLLSRNGLTETEARRRIEAQMPLTEKVRRATYVIDTSKDFAETDRQIGDVARLIRGQTMGSDHLV